MEEKKDSVGKKEGVWYHCVCYTDWHTTGPTGWECGHDNQCCGTHTCQDKGWRGKKCLPPPEAPAPASSTSFASSSLTQKGSLDSRNGGASPGRPSRDPPLGDSAVPVRTHDDSEVLEADHAWSTDDASSLEQLSISDRTVDHGAGPHRSSATATPAGWEPGVHQAAPAKVEREDAVLLPARKQSSSQTQSSSREIVLAEQLDQEAAPAKEREGAVLLPADQ